MDGFLFHHGADVVSFEPRKGRSLEHRNVLQFFIELLLHLTSELDLFFVLQVRHRDSL